MAIRTSAPTTLPRLNLGPVPVVALRGWREPVDDPQPPGQVGAIEIAGKHDIGNDVRAGCDFDKTFDEFRVLCPPAFGTFQY